MSKMEHIKGKLIPVQIFQTLEATAALILINMGLKDVVDDEDAYESTIEALEDHGYREYVIKNDMIYKVEKENLDPYDDIFEASKNPDGSIDFEVKYYNGGCSFNEAIDNAMKKL